MEEFFDGLGSLILTIILLGITIVIPGSCAAFFVAINQCPACGG